MRLLYIGDVVGQSGRKAVQDHLPGLRDRLRLDFILVNGENAAHGFGLTEKICQEFFALGVDVVTTGNHVWDQREVISYIEREPRLLRPANLPPGTPGRGVGVFAASRGRKVMVLHLMGRLFMDAIDDPFQTAERELARQRLGATVDAVVVDVHAEATSEKMALGHVLDGRVSAVIGTHTHVPTADAMLLPAGTAYQTDVGMCGDYDSVIGMKKATAIARFVRKMPTEKLEPAKGDGTLCATFVETDDKSGLAHRIEPVRLGGRLKEQVPEG